MEYPDYILLFLFAREVLRVPAGFAGILEFRLLHSRGDWEVTEARTP